MKDIFIVCLFILSTIVVNSENCLQNCELCSAAGTCLRCISTNYIAIAQVPAQGCLPCRTGCLSCSSQISQCKNCAVSYYLSPIDGQCKKCMDNNCQQCDSQAPEICLTCSNGYFLDSVNGQCESCKIYSHALTCRNNLILSCDVGFYVFNGQSCQPCATNCLRCSNKNYCLSCRQGFYGLNCLPCLSSCKTCINNLTCQSCAQGKSLVNLQCVSCSDLNCKICSNGICQKCRENYYLNSSLQCSVINQQQFIAGCQAYKSNTDGKIKCIQCTQGYYLIEEYQICGKCSLLCSKCSNYYQTSSCETCSSFAFNIDSRVCHSLEIYSNGEHLLHLNKWNYPTLFVLNGQKQYVVGQGNCPSEVYGKSSTLFLGQISGYQFIIHLKFGLYLSQDSNTSQQITLKFNQLTFHQSINFDRSLDYINFMGDTAPKCSGSTNFQYTLSIQFSSLSNGIKGSDLTNNNSISLESNDLSTYFSIQEAIVQYKPCHSSCKECSVYSQCLVCQDGSFYLERQRCVEKCSQFLYLDESSMRCTKRCPMGTFPSTLNIFWKCQICPQQCSYCSSATQCFSCAQNFYLYKSKCISQCPDTFYNNQITRHCEKCHFPCYTCLTQSSCLSCSFNFLFNSTCVGLTECPSGYYADLNTLKCQECSTLCLECNEKSTKCTKCSNGHLFDNQCIGQCPLNYIQLSSLLDGNICLMCSFPCWTCSVSAQNCTNCLQGFLYNNQCVENCPDLYYEDYSLMKCVGCQYPCETCSGYGSSCLTCVSGYILHQDQNYCMLREECIDSSFYNISDGKCFRCPDECVSCESWNNCSECQPNFFLIDKKCLQICPLGYFNNPISKQCILCSSQCSTCMYESNFCTSCQLNYQLRKNNYCQLGCNLDQLYPTCQKCVSPCFSCQSSINQCTSCVNEFYLDRTINKCLLECQDGFYPLISLGEQGGLCLACKDPCQHCISQQICKKCKFPLYLFITDSVRRSGICIAQCPIYHFFDKQSRICQPCNEPCLECSSATQCLSCINGAFNEGKCLDMNQCPYGKYLSTLLSKIECLPCSQNCKTCEDLNICTQCFEGMYLQGVTCVQQCPLNKFNSLQTGRCEYCSFPCYSCSGSSSSCLSCQQPSCQSLQTQCISFYHYQQQCLLSCPSGTFANMQSQQCIFCYKPCKTCSSENICTSCLQQLYLLNNFCYRKCPNGYYPDFISGSCTKCVFPCKTCKSQTECITCLEGLYIDGICVMTQLCPSGYYLKTSEQELVCLTCNQQCQQCEDSPQQCKKCSNTQYKLLNGQCIGKCPQYFYQYSDQVKDIKTCRRCPLECSSCQSQVKCTSCVEFYYHFEDKCIQQCPQGYYEATNNTCLVCQSQCKSCVGSSSNCMSCNDFIEDQGQIRFRFLYQFKCYFECPMGTYPNVYNRICRDCNFPCQLCQSAQQCVQCVQGFYLSTNGLCLEQCLNPMTIDESGRFCIESCPADNFKISKIRSISDMEIQYNQCSKECSYPNIYIRSSNKCESRCVSLSGQQVYINQNLICEQVPQGFNSEIITKATLNIFIDVNYTLKAKLEFSQEIDYQLTDLKNSINLHIGEVGSQELIASRMLISQQFPQNIDFQIVQQDLKNIEVIINHQFFEKVDFTKDQIIKLTFLRNSNLLIKSKRSSIPLQQSTYTAKLKKNLYEPYANYYQIAVDSGSVQSFRIFGEIVVGFILCVGLCLFFYNWYAKIYESLHLLQFIFLLSTLQIQYPPNLYFFLQGFRNSHFYFIGNWFINGLNQNSVASSTPKIAALFVDSNFIKVCGHVICMAIILGFVTFLLFISKYLPERKDNNEKEAGDQVILSYAKIRNALVNKFSVIRWSHIHDFVITITMIIFFGFVVQISDYSAESTIQVMGIFCSWAVLLTICAYYGYMGFKLHQIVKLSKNDPNRFCDKNYLFRDNMMSITEAAVHPQQLYLNYVRVFRIVLIGVLIGLSGYHPLFCIGCLSTITIFSSYIYLIVKPYPDNTQNMLLGFADIFTFLGLIFIAGIQFSNVDDSISGYIQTKWQLGLGVIVLSIISLLLLFIELIISIVRGNESPHHLEAQDLEKEKIQFKGTPKKIKVYEKMEFQGWSCSQFKGTTNFDCKDTVIQ